MLTENAIKVLEKRYLLKDENGKIIETPEKLFWRVAAHIAKVDEHYGVSLQDVGKLADNFYAAMINCEFMPNTPCLMNAGKFNGQLSACFVLPVEDTMEGIFDAIKWAAIIHKTGGGTGFSFSRLRPNGSIVGSTKGIASGPVSFMKVFNAATEAVKQGGSRRGANMGILRVDHPDILEFINCKQDLSQVTNFNISVGITDEFMATLKKHTIFYPRDPETGEHLLSTCSRGIASDDLFDDIIENAWQSGEPGCIFIDRINQLNPGREFEEIEATNPCGEIPLPPFDVCNLLSINISKFIINNNIDYIKLEKTIKLAYLFLDNMIDANHFPLPEIKEQVLKSRRIGLGIMGWADTLIKMAIKYDSDKALEVADELMFFIQNIAMHESQERGQKFGKVYNLNRRNTTLTMIAPTGTISIIAGCSSGIEPLYAIAYTRNVMEGTRLVEVNSEFEKVAKEQGFYSDELMYRISQTNSIQDFSEIPDWVKNIFRTSADIPPEWHVKMQAVFQKYCDSAVSKTINLPENATKEDVKKAYLLAYELGCKGVTVYRDGSRPGQVLSTGATPKEARDTEQIGAFGTFSEQFNNITPPLPDGSLDKSVIHIPADSIPQPIFNDLPLMTPYPCTFKSTTLPRPDKLLGSTEKIKTGYGNLYVTVNELQDKPFEIFATIGKSGFSMMADAEAISRLISLCLRSNIPLEDIIKQIKGIGGANPIFHNGDVIYSIPDAIARVLMGYIDKDKVEQLELDLGTDKDIGNEFCPDCDSQLIHTEGCIKCESCGYSKC